MSLFTPLLLLKQHSQKLAIAFISTIAFNTQFAAASNILIFGDSLSAGYGISHEHQWSTLLNKRIAEQKLPYKVVNLSLSGEDSSGGLARFPKALADATPSIVILELGGNDGLRGQSIKKLKSNLSKMIELAQQANAKVLLMGMKIPPNYGKRYTTSFENAYTALQKKYQLSFLPFMLEGVAGNPKFMQNDGIHPNAKAQPLILDNIWPKLLPLLNSKNSN